MSHLGLGQTPALSTPAPRRRTIPYDYQFYFPIFDKNNESKSFLDKTLSSSLAVSIEAAFVAVSIGYGFLPLARTITFGPGGKGDADPSALTFGEIVTSLAEKFGEGRIGGGGPQTERALIAGIQVNPVLSQRLLQELQTEEGEGHMQRGELGELFRTVEPPPDQIQFLYALYDKGTGRAFQSEPLLNIAGLGIADGDRPFRYFATPIVFAPRSTIQLDVIPKTDFRGELYVTLHGYKVLGGAGTPTGHKLPGPTPVRRMRRP